MEAEFDLMMEKAHEIPESFSHFLMSLIGTYLVYQYRNSLITYLQIKNID